MVHILLDTESRKMLEEIVEKNNGKVLCLKGILCIKFDNLTAFLRMVISITAVDTHPESPFNFPQLNDCLIRVQTISSGQMIVTTPYKY